MLLIGICDKINAINSNSHSKLLEIRETNRVDHELTDFIEL